MTGLWTLHAPAALAVVVPVLMMPGLDFAAVSRNALAGGRTAGIAAALGNTLGASVWIVGAALGTGTVTARIPGAEGALRLLGGLVLFWFAWRFLSLARSAPSDARSALLEISRTGALREGALAALLNPKTPLFFAAVFGASGLATASTADRNAFALVVCLLHFAWFAGVALVLERIGTRPGTGPVLRISAGVVAIVLTSAGLMALRG
ncbi:LysE family translocator [Jannaschia formosa]|uniref:LysE family translocator n=1 Tax=Jannaschia formosa TaxID=2259592 RepID=UPI000E1BE984|nr:LysE family transporter [Jannaschia formosa]TFL16335.1 hypothetical protein DR046_20410 [Jannaschia formosa]